MRGGWMRFSPADQFRTWAKALQRARQLLGVLHEVGAVRRGIGRAAFLRQKVEHFEQQGCRVVAADMADARRAVGAADPNADRVVT